MTDTHSNVRQITDKQPAPAARFTVQASLDGFPVSVEVEGKAGDLRALVDRLKAIGAEPPQVQTPARAQKSASVPVCPDHGTPMKASRKPGTWFCPRPADDRGYCPHKG